MLAKQPFARRIVIAFTLMTLVVSGTFSLGIVAVVHFIEEHLVTQELGHELDSVLNDVLVHGDAPRLDAVTRFFASNLPGYAIPEAFRGLADGFTELVLQSSDDVVLSSGGTVTVDALDGAPEEWEPWEGCLVQFGDVTVTSTGTGRVR